MSDEHFTVDGTLIEAWATHASFQPKDGPPAAGGSRDFRGQRHTNQTHASTTDPDARLYRRTYQGEAKLAYLGHLLIEHRHGLIVGVCATQADGFAEREAGLRVMDALPARTAWRRRTIGADKGYDARDFVGFARALGFMPHVTQHTTRTGGRAIDRRTTRHPGYAQSQAPRPRVEPAFGWLKAIAGIRKVKVRGVAKVDGLFVLASAAVKLLRLPTLLQGTT
jgi:hypothetical protein